MSINNLIAREIERQNNLPSGSYAPVGQFADINITVLDENNTIKDRIANAVESADQIVYPGKVVFIYNAFSDTPAFYSKPINNPTIADLQKSLDDGLSATEDHRDFLEELVVIGHLDSYLKAVMIENSPTTTDAIFINLETCS